jgi:hypothetical protein
LARRIFLPLPEVGKPFGPGQAVIKAGRRSPHGETLYLVECSSCGKERERSAEALREVKTSLCQPCAASIISSKAKLRKTRGGRLQCKEAQCARKGEWLLPKEFYGCKIVSTGCASVCSQCARLRSDLKTYGFASFDEARAFRQRNNGKCEITGCGGQGTHIDHCHKTGKLRGLLCISCNTSLASNVTVETLLGRAAYLEEFYRSLDVK